MNETCPRVNGDEIGKIIVDAAVAVHMELGPGLLESVYEGWNIKNNSCPRENGEMGIYHKSLSP